VPLKKCGLCGRTIKRKDMEARRYVRSSWTKAYYGPCCYLRLGGGKRRKKEGRKCTHAETVKEKFAANATLASPPEDWIVERGYGRMTADYYSGGRYRTGTRSRLVLSIHGDKARLEMKRHYAYEQATGKALNRFDLPHFEQFDYSGSARRGETKRSQILRLTA
jgi:hypothetical protein